MTSGLGRGRGRGVLLYGNGTQQKATVNTTVDAKPLQNGIFNIINAFQFLKRSQYNLIQKIFLSF